MSATTPVDEWRDAPDINTMGRMNETRFSSSIILVFFALKFPIIHYVGGRLSCLYLSMIYPFGVRRSVKDGGCAIFQFPLCCVVDWVGRRKREKGANEQGDLS